ncbi:MAG: hypothetical protein BGO49_24655 [Planctomycetales bacterium 71-10]|nr:MAG: hypothetical protein BGO49_24655 [Planctomycetales bacterium 71-10]
MIDSMASLAFSVYSAKGVYAALLGSGVSRSSGIPTGWDITLDFVRKLAALRDENPSDPEAWYREAYGNDPDYSVLLEQLGKEPGDRNFSLRPYFEPTDEEREEGRKRPTPAHKAIAALVAKGYIKVIVTTNFDRLMEQALAEFGVTPDVVSNADQVRGMRPLAHSPCTIIKVHGDYTDTRIKNTTSELEGYEPEINRLLDQVFDEYGMIVCGWSADWDQALRASIERCPNRRFTTYWSAYATVSGKAQELCTRRAAQIISGMGADDFFGQLQEKVEALEAMDTSRHPLSKQMAVASVKKYISEDKYRTQLHDLFMGEAERLSSRLLGDKYPKNRQTDKWTELVPLIPAYDADAETLMAMMIAGGFWSNDSKLWLRCLERVAAASESVEGDPLIRNSKLYPVRLLLYGVGVAAALAGHDGIVAALLTQGHTKRHQRRSLWHAIGEDVHVEMFNAVIHFGTSPAAKSRFPISQHLFSVLQPEFQNYVSGESELRSAFERFEYIAALVYADQERQQSPQSDHVWGPIGIFARWKFQTEVADELKRQIEQHGNELPLLKGGAFGGKVERLEFAKTRFDEFVKRHAASNGY